MNLDFLTFFVAVFATYRLTRLVVVDTIFDGPRDALDEWLRKGETQSARETGQLLVGLAAALVVMAFVGRLLARWGIIGDALVSDDHNLIMAWMLGAAPLLFLLGGLVGYRYKFQEGVECKWCVSVWVSGLVGTSLALWGHWPTIPAVVFGLGIAGLTCFLNLAEDWVATATEGIEHDNKRKRAEAKARERAAIEG